MSVHITAVLGARKVGKTTGSEILNSMHPDSTRLSMMAFGIADFCHLHEMTREQFWLQRDRESNRSLFNVFSEYQRKKNPRIFLDQCIAYIQQYPSVIIDDIMYYNELEELIKLKSRLVLMTTTNDIKKLRDWNPAMDQQPMEMEVSSILADTVKNWKNIVIIENNGNIPELRYAIGNI